jgi:hypothetical protein
MSQRIRLAVLLFLSEQHPSPSDLQAMPIGGTGPGRCGCPPDRRRASIVERERTENPASPPRGSVLHGQLTNLAFGLLSTPIIMWPVGPLALNGSWVLT